MNATPRSGTGHRRRGRSKPAPRWVGGFRQCRRVSFAVEAVERGRAALRLCRRRPGADRAFQASARLRRLSGAAADPGGGGGAVARRGACRGEPRPLSPQIRHRRGRARRPIRVLPAAGRVLSVARCRRRRSRRRCACGARRRSACCRAAIRRAPPRAAPIRERAISASRSCTTRRLSKPPLRGSRACCSSGFARCVQGGRRDGGGRRAVGLRETRGRGDGQNRIRCRFPAGTG